MRANATQTIELLITDQFGCTHSQDNLLQLLRCHVDIGDPSTCCDEDDPQGKAAPGALGIQSNPGGLSLRVFPNPNAGESQLAITIGRAPQQAPLSITITNHLGQLVHLEQATASGFETVVPLNLKHLASGIYSVAVASEMGTAVARLVLEQ